MADTDRPRSPSGAAVDELLELPIDVDTEMSTGVYDVSFLNPLRSPLPLTRLEDARVGLGLFIDEAIEALKVPSDELTPDQRLHVATILSYIEGLAARFDKIRVPGYVHSRKVRTTAR